MSNLRSTILGSAGLLIWTAGLLALAAIDDPRLRFSQYLACMGLATAGWLLVNHSQPKGRVFVAMVVAALGARLLFWNLAPAFSEDVFRYVYEGRLVWFLGPSAPFAHPPAAAPQLGLPPELLDAAWLRINHPQISTIYPPLSQLSFAVAGGLGLWLGHTLGFLKALLIFADLGTWFLLDKALRKAGAPRHRALLWGLCPLVVVEVAREGHADSLATLGLAAGIFGFVAARPLFGQLGHVVAALAKLNGGLGLLVGWRSTSRGVLGAGVLLLVLGVPWLVLGLEAGRGLSEYASRWRAGDGAFSVLLSLVEWAMQGSWRRVAGVTFTAHTVARAVTAALFLTAMIAALRTSFPKIQVPARTGALIFLLLLLAPTLHPWYALWILPFCVAAPGFALRPAAVVLIVLVPLLHHPGWYELTEGLWRDRAPIRALVHVPVWLTAAFVLVRRRTLGYAPARAPEGG